MFYLDTLYLTFLSGIVVIVLAGMILGNYVPEIVSMRKYRKSRLILASAYLVLAVPCVVEYLLQQNHLPVGIQNPLVLMIASFEGCLFTMALTTLLQPSFLTYRRFFAQLSIPVAMTCWLIPAILLATPAVLKMVFYGTLVVYFVQLCYYVWLFHQKYTRCLKQVDNYYAEEEEKRFRWIKQVFFLALGIGVMSLLSGFFNHLWYDIYTVVYTLFYIFLAVKFNNYVALFQMVYPATSLPEVPVKQEATDCDVPQENADPEPYTGTDLRMEQAIQEWVAQKRYTETGVSLDDIAISLGTNRSYLSRHLNTRMNTNFKSWRTQLRIEEAQRLLITHPEMSIAEIGTMVGIHDRTNFHHRFQNVTGITPTEWRMQHEKK